MSGTGDMPSAIRFIESHGIDGSAHGIRTICMPSGASWYRIDRRRMKIYGGQSDGMAFEPGEYTREDMKEIPDGAVAATITNEDHAFNVIYNVRWHFREQI